MEHSEHQQPDSAPESSSQGTAGVDIPIQEKDSDTLEQLQAALQEARDEAARERENALRVRAEMDNLHKRLERELDKSRRFALERVMSDLLPVIDGLEATLGSDHASLEQLREGAELTLKMMTKLIADHSLKVIDPLHQPFDPELHQAMSLQATQDYPPDTVVQVFQKGYQLHERLLRPALVVVAKAAD